jgi:hypothetical protein
MSRMNPELETIRDMVSGVLARTLPTPEMIREKITQLRALYPDVSDQEAENLAREFEHIHGVTMDIGAKLESPGFEKWLDGRRADIDFFYWDRYRRLLGERGFSGQVLATLDKLTDRTLGLLENPEKPGPWDRRGMVVGHVQSGKTANYTGLVCKAADAGYKVIIVIAGIHNNLRSQTQARLDEGFVGFDSASLLSRQPGAQSVIGVGRYDSRRKPSAFTNTVRDFNKATATSIGIPLANLNEPALFVIKKNSSTLKSLLEWLSEHNATRGTRVIPAPMLLIDDEADNASINIGKGQEEVSKINGQIRTLLDIFERSCYVGYTATPFANIFIDPDSDDEMFGDDLFPRDFIVSLDPPDNYFGAERVFLSDSDGEAASVVRHIDDNEDLLPLKHKNGHEVTALPSSLEVAIRAFVIARAIRLIRGQANAHHSMLVNASRFTDVQRQLRNEIHNRIRAMTASIRVNGNLPPEDALQDPEILGLHEVFREEYAHGEVSWENVQAKLLDSIAAISVIEVNSRSSDSLDYSAYPEGHSVIAVGGFSLSRGLTLEGLTISYFLRNSMMYDTLMQMGRWFGYRAGYGDLCRIWMPEEAEGWYAHIAESIEELRDEFRRMEAANATPREFGLKVRSHPDTLIVTARNKMGTGERLVVSIGLGNQFVETAVLRRDPDSLAANRDAAETLMGAILSSGAQPDQPYRGGSGHLFSGVAVDLVLEFLTQFRNHEGSFLTETDPIRRYILDRADDELSEWDVYFPSLRNHGPKSLQTTLHGLPVICQRRSPGQRSNDSTLLITDKQRVASRGVEAVGLTEVEIDAAKQGFLNETDPPRSPDSTNFPDRIYRRVRQRPMIVVHMLAIGTDDEDLSAADAVVAWSISFPSTRLEERKVEYVVNTTWFRERYRQEEDEEDAAGDNNV